MIEMMGISKSFPGVKALDNVSMQVAKGEIHALVGENGAGKSTLMKILSGAYSADAGHIRLDGEEVKQATPANMIEKGIAVIYQELMLLNHQTVAENIFLGRQPKTKLGLVNYKKMKQLAGEIIQELRLDLDPDALVCNLSVAKRQMVEIARAMSRNAKVIVLDEPTAVLGDSELKGLFALVKELSQQGVTFIYISHRLKEIFELCTHLTILKDGQVVESGCVQQYDTDKLVSKMVGRELVHVYPERTGRTIGEPVLRVENMCREGVLKNINFTLHRGEILGLAGLAGAGRTEVLRAIIGSDAIDSGSVELHGKKVKFSNPRQAIESKIGMVPEERKTQGLLLMQDITYNTSIASLPFFSKLGIINIGKERQNAQAYIDKMHTRPSNVNTVVRFMSGGNQQKVVISKNLTTQCNILLVDEPTRGVDVGAKQEIYQIIHALVCEGMSVIMVSSELTELIGMCDRILVMNEGYITGEVDHEHAEEELLMSYATADTSAWHKNDKNA